MRPHVLAEIADDLEPGAEAQAKSRIVLPLGPQALEVGIPFSVEDGTPLQFQGTALPFGGLPSRLQLQDGCDFRVLLDALGQLRSDLGAMRLVDPPIILKALLLFRREPEVYLCDRLPKCDLRLRHSVPSAGEWRPRCWAGFPVS